MTFLDAGDRKEVVFFVPYNGKIADITHADTNNHTLDMQTALSDTRIIVGAILGAQRMAGTGNFGMKPNRSHRCLLLRIYSTCRINQFGGFNLNLSSFSS